MNIRTLSVFLCFFFASATSIGAMAPSCSSPILTIDWTGTVTAGSKAKLIEAAGNGRDLRVGWNLDFDDDGKSDLTHWSDAIFISVFEGEVFTQVQSIQRQHPVSGQAKVELSGEADIWHGLIGSDGILRSRFKEAGALPERRVASVWCNNSNKDVPATRDPLWRSVFRTGVNGEELSGSRDNLLMAVRAGLPIRVGWGLSRERDGKTISVEHVADPVFVTIVNSDEVVVQLPEHISQKSYWNANQAFFDEPAVMWRGILSTTGTFDAIWVNRTTGETIRRSPQRAAFTWYAMQSPKTVIPTLAVPDGIKSDLKRDDQRIPPR